MTENTPCEITGIYERRTTMKQPTTEKKILIEVLEGENYFLTLMEGTPFDELSQVTEKVTNEFYFWNKILEDLK